MDDYSVDYPVPVSDASKSEAPIDFEREMARLRFLMAMLDVDQQEIENNPWHRLECDVWPRWHEAMFSPVDRMPVTSSPPKLYFGDYREREKRKEAIGAALLRAWAEECWLVEETPDRSLRAARWVLDDAARHCQWKSDRKMRAAASEMWQDMAQKPTDSGEAPPKLGVPGQNELVIPMPNSARFENESWSDYKKRARAALALYLRQLVRQDSAPVRAPQPAPKTKLDHFVWLVLYQCCQWPLRRIQESYPHLNTPQAVWQGLTQKAALVGIAVRPRTLKKIS